MISIERGDFKKSIHVKLLDSTHTALRIQSFRLKLSVQEMMEELAQRIVIEDPVIMGVLQDLAKRKRDKDYRRFSEIDAETIYELIENG